jgi:hypothetical protein
MFVTNNPTVQIALGMRPVNVTGLPEDLFDCNEDVALGTFAALCCSPNVKDGDTYLVSIETLALRVLALFAAGADVKFHTEDFRDLDKLAARCANDGNHELVGWVRRAAYDRAKSLGMAGPGRVDTDGNQRVTGFAYIEPEDGRGYGELAGDLRAELFRERQTFALSPEAAEWQRLYESFTPQVVAPESTVDAWTRKRLLTFAAVFSALKPRLCNLEVEAVVLLALYGAGLRIDLGKHEFEMLRMRAETYISRMQADRYAEFRNRKMAEFALEAAFTRAKLAGFIVG